MSHSIKVPASVAFARSCSRVVSSSTIDELKNLVTRAHGDDLGVYALYLSAVAVLSVTKRVIHAITKGAGTLKFSASDANKLDRLYTLKAGANQCVKVLRDALATWQTCDLCSLNRALSTIDNDALDLVQEAANKLLKVLQDLRKESKLNLAFKALQHDVSYGVELYVNDSFLAVPSSDYDCALWSRLNQSILDYPVPDKHLRQQIVYTLDAVPQYVVDYVAAIVGVYKAVRKAITNERSTRVNAGMVYASLDVLQDDGEGGEMPTVDSLIYRCGKWQDIGGNVSSSFQGVDHDGLYTAGISEIERVEETVDSLGLTERQKKVLGLLRQGMSIRQIAKKLNMVPSGAYKHVSAVRAACRKIGFVPSSAMVERDNRKMAKAEKAVRVEMLQAELDEAWQAVPQSVSRKMAGMNRHWRKAEILRIAKKAIKRNGMKARAQRLKNDVHEREELAMHVGAIAERLTSVKPNAQEAIKNAANAKREALAQEWKRALGENVVLAVGQFDERYTIQRIPTEAEKAEAAERAKAEKEREYLEWYMDRVDERYERYLECEEAIAKMKADFNYPVRKDCKRIH